MATGASHRINDGGRDDERIVDAIATAQQQTPVAETPVAQTPAPQTPAPQPQTPVLGCAAIAVATFVAAAVATLAVRPRARQGGVGELRSSTMRSTWTSTAV